MKLSLRTQLSPFFGLSSPALAQRGILHNRGAFSTGRPSVESAHAKREEKSPVSAPKEPSRWGRDRAFAWAEPQPRPDRVEIRFSILSAAS